MKTLHLLALTAALVATGTGRPSYAADPIEVSIWQVEVEPSGPGKYKIKGSVFGIGDPVHETLTRTALERAGLVGAPASRSDARMVQILRGVFWNDDPCGQLFVEDDFNPLRPSLGVAWYLDFQAAKSVPTNSSETDFQKLGCKLLGRSHFGDMQFLHAMAHSNGLHARETADQIIQWTTLMYRVAIGDVDPRLSLAVDGTNLLPSNIIQTSAMQLLLAKSANEARMRALGSMLHTIQDSFAHGHVTRTSNPTEISQFLCYSGQNEKKHAHDDAWGKGATELEKTLIVPGAPEALDASVLVVKHFLLGTDWRAVKRHLEAGPFKLKNDASPSGPGEYK